MQKVSIIKRWFFSLLVLGLPVVAMALASLDEEVELLPPEEAFALTSTTTGDALRLVWTIADGYYLYKDKFRFESDSPGITLGDALLPAGKTRNDEFFGEVEILRGRAVVELPITSDGPPPETIKLKAVSQGCADIGVCYPPYTHDLELDAPPGLLKTAAPKQSGALDALSALTQLGQSLGGTSGGADEFLDPDVAYVMDAVVEGGDTVSVRWEIADGYYLYRDKITLALKNSNGVTLGAAQIPPGKIKEDEFFGRMSVFYTEAIATAPLVRTAPAATTVSLDIGYQGCADAGLCYPPMTKTVELVLAAAGGRGGPGVSQGGGEGSGIPPGLNLPSTDDGLAAAPLSEQDQIAKSLATGSSGLIIATFFGFGLLLAFTPCVLPMVPILSSIVVGRGEALNTRHAFILSLVYVLAMAATYTVAGVFAGLFGQNLQAAFQDPWILASFSAVFVLLSLSMFGFYDLQVPASWQAKLARISNRQEGGTYFGVAIMGFLSALIVGPCVAAPLAGALIYIGQTGDAALGGLALFALSLGMGAPLLVIGTSAGRLLPKAGAWMEAVKAVFGVLLLGVAIYLLERILPGWISMLLWAALLIVVAVYMGALDALQAGVSGWRRLSKGAGLIMMVYGVLVMVGAAAGGHDVFQPLKGSALVSGAGRQESELQFKRVKGLEGVRAELMSAAAQGKPVVLDYYADWCVSCKEMEKYTFSNPEVQAVLKVSVLLQVDVTANDAKDQALLREYGLFGPPAILFFGPDGRERPRFRVVGFMKAARFRDHARDALDDNKDLAGM